MYILLNNFSIPATQPASYTGKWIRIYQSKRHHVPYSVSVLIISLVYVTCYIRFNIRQSIPVIILKRSEVCQNYCYEYSFCTCFVLYHRNIKTPEVRTYTVTKNCVRVTIFLLGKQYIKRYEWQSVSYLSYLSCEMASFLCRVVMSSVSCSALQYFSHIILQTTRFSGKCYWTQNVCFDFLYNFCLKHFSL
jgi:hypothetical protein